MFKTCSKLLLILQWKVCFTLLSRTKTKRAAAHTTHSDAFMWLCSSLLLPLLHASMSDLSCRLLGIILVKCKVTCCYSNILVRLLNLPADGIVTDCLSIFHMMLLTYSIHNCIYLHKHYTLSAYVHSLCLSHCILGEQ